MRPRTLICPELGSVIREMIFRSVLFARSVRPDHADRVAFLNVEAYILESPERIRGFANSIRVLWRRAPKGPAKYFPKAAIHLGSLAEVIAL